jgi:hypothetical protein
MARLKRKKREQYRALHTQFYVKVLYHNDNQSQEKVCGNIHGEGAGDKSETDLELADADDGEEAPALGAFLAVAEEEVAAAGSAKVADEDVGGAEAGTEELGAIGFA